MTETTTNATVPKKSRKKYVVIAIIIGVLAYLDYSKTNYVLGGSCSTQDSTEVTSTPFISVEDSIKAVTPASVVIDTTKKDTTKK